MEQSIQKHGSTITKDFKKVEDAAFEFNAFLEKTDRFFRKNAITIPDIDSKKSVADAYWKLFEVVSQFEKNYSDCDLSAYKVAFRSIISPWLCRSYFFCRAFIKPNGYAGDYKVIDTTYDLEQAVGNDPTEPAIVNCLDYVISTLHSVVSLWERRHWLKDLLLEELNNKGKLKVLDVACGGARYIQDFLESAKDSSKISITLLDQDPAALAFAETINLKDWSENITTICAPIKHLSSALPDEKYDFIISSGLFDYLDHPTGSAMLDLLSRKLETNGVLAITNFHLEDGSGVAKDWGSDWPLVLREDHHVTALFPENVPADIKRSENGSLIMAKGRKLN